MRKRLQYSSFVKRIIMKNRKRGWDKTHLKMKSDANIGS
jgi:hypothetical protein